MEYEFTLEKKAKSAGGDKYQCDTIPEFNIYFPQVVSRPAGGKVLEKIKITIKPSTG
jgi:hypothetical protein